MTILPPEPRIGKDNRRSAVHQYCLGTGMILPLLLLIGCAGSPPPTSDDPPQGAATEVETGELPGSGPSMLASFPDSLNPDTLPDEIVVDLPTGPDGYASLEDLEALYTTALSLVSDGQVSAAEDHLYTLQDQVQLPLPANADSLYTAHRQSLERRLWLLGGLLTEQAAFGSSSGNADSLLATGYGTLTQVAFPDSLVPATGVDLPAITADLLKLDNKAVRKWENYFTGRGRRNFQFWLDRKAAADSLITSILVAEGLPTELIYLAMIESGLSPRAVSNVGAVGPWQFMPGTAKSFHLRRNWWIDERKDMEMSTRAAARYLTQLYKQFGDWALVLAAYNSGENRVSRRIRQHGHDNFWSLRLPAQTTDYVPKYIAAARIGENPEKYGFKTNAPTPLRYDILPVNDATDLELIASCAGVNGTEIKKLNPALLRGATPPDLKKYPVRVPAGTGVKAARALAKVPADRRLTWRRHRVARGETLGQIARQYGSSVQDIARLNKMGNVHLIRPGDQLLIPMPAELASKAQKRASEKGHYVPPEGYERVSYKVKSGDTLGGIARKLGVSVPHLRKVNGIYKSHLIYPGQRIYAYRPGQ